MAAVSGRACAVLLLALCGAPSYAHAEALYRCVGASGETVFSSNPQGYRQCRRLPAPAVPVSHVASLKPRGPEDGVGRKAATGQVAAPLARWSYSESKSPPPGPSLAGQPGARVLRGTVYRVVHADGSVEYTNVPPAGRGRAVTLLFSYIATCVACDVHSPIDWNHVRLDLSSYAEAVRAASREFGVEEAFLRAVIHAESAFQPHALSLKGAQGLMQLMPATAGDMGVVDAFDAVQNIRGGARYLALLLKNFNGDERLAAAAYNAGPAAVQRYNGVPPYAETEVYVQRVATLRQRYGTALPRALAATAPTL